MISKSLGDDSITRIDLSKYTKTGYNTFRLENLFPEQSSLTVEVPFPRLVETKKLQNQFSKEKLKKIDQLIESEIQQGFPGATLLIAKEGKIIKHTAYGYSNRYDREGVPLASPTEMTLDTLFDMASNTKMYATNYAVMKLVSEGKLNVNLPIGEYLVDYKGEGRESRLVSDLLNHTAGYIPVVNFHDKENNLGKHLFSQSKGHTQKLLIEKVPFKHSRGLKTVYSDVDYMLLGTLIERITQQSLDQYLSENIYLPLELEKTTFNPLLNGFSKSEIAATELQGNTRQSTVDFVNTRTDVVHGEVHDEKAFYSMQGVAGHAGLFSTAKDTAVLASVILNRGGYGKHRFFGSSEMDQFLKPSNLNVTMGLGWRRAGNGERIWHFGPYASPYAIGHTGWTGTVTVIDPFHDLIIVLLTNKKHTTMKPEMVDGISTDNLIFAGDEFETGKYGSIISLVYEAFLEK